MPSQKPTPLDPQPTSIPFDLKQSRSWVTWRYEYMPKTDKWTKPPYKKDGIHHASVSDPNSWCDFDEAIGAMYDNEFDGIGHVLQKDQVFIDLDHVIDPETGEVSAWASEIIERFQGAYIELSPSGEGYHILCRGIPKQTGKFGENNHLEIYSTSSARYCTMTGRQVGSGLIIKAQEALDWLASKYSKPEQKPMASKILKEGKFESIEALLEVARQASNNEKLLDLWEGNDSAYSSSSEGDLAFMSVLAFYTQDEAWLDTIFRRSKRMRDKWDEKRGALTYGELTIKKAIAGVEQTYIGVVETNSKVESATKEWVEPIDIFSEYPVPKITRDMLPDVIAKYAFDCGDLIGVDPCMIGIPAIVSCAAALHDGIQIQPKRHERGWTESARLWCALVGEPSVKKSPAIKRGSKELRKIDMRLHTESDSLLAQYEQQLESWEQSKKDAKKNSTIVPLRPERPARKRMVVEDVTVEALSEILKDNDRGVLGIMDELSGFFGAMDAYSGAKAAGKDRAHWLESYNGGGRIVDRVGRGSVKIPNWSVSMVGGIQPDAIKRISKSMVDDGLMQRFMVVIGANCPEFDRPEDSQAHADYQDLVKALFSIVPSENTVKLSEDAHTERLAINELTESLIASAYIPSKMKSHLGKWSGLFARLLLIYHAIECVKTRQYPAAVEVSGQTARKVATLMSKFLLPHAVSYYIDVLGGNQDTDHMRSVACLLLAKEVESINPSFLMRGYFGWRSFDAYTKMRIMDSLEEHGWIEAQHSKYVAKKGSVVWLVNPKIYEVFADVATKEKIERANTADRIRSLKGKAMFSA